MMMKKIKFKNIIFVVFYGLGMFLCFILYKKQQLIIKDKEIQIDRITKLNQQLLSKIEDNRLLEDATTQLRDSLKNEIDKKEKLLNDYRTLYANNKKLTNENEKLFTENKKINASLKLQNSYFKPIEEETIIPIMRNRTLKSRNR